MATSEKSGLSCAKSTQCVKLEGITHGLQTTEAPKSGDKKSRSGVCLTGPIRSFPLDDFKGEDGVGFGVEEKVVRVHCVGFARHEIAPLVAFVSRQDYSAGGPVCLPWLAVATSAG